MYFSFLIPGEWPHLCGWEVDVCPLSISQGQKAEESPGAPITAPDSKGPQRPSKSKAYLSDFMKLAGILTLDSSGSCRRLVMRDCDNTGGPRTEMSLATGRRRIGCSMGEQSETSASGAWSTLE